MKLEAVIAAAVVAATGCVQASGAWAQQAWRPAKAVELIVPTAPGGANDPAARAIRQVVREEKLVVTPVEAINKPGGNQSIAVAYLQQHSADPHYLLIANPTLIGSHISGISAVNYTDYTPLALLLREDSPIGTVREAFDRVKADPEAVAFGMVSRGGPSHPALSAAAYAAGIDAKKLKTLVFKGVETLGLEDAFKDHRVGPSRVQFQNKDPRGFDEFARRTVELPATGYANTFSGVLGKRPALYSMEKDLRQLKVPLLLVNGDEDDKCLEPGVFIKRVCPSGALAVIPWSGHLVNLEESDVFNRLLLDFLTLVDAGRWRPRDPRSPHLSVLANKG